jgi:ABC-type amino acid transport system permease subunit
MSGSKAAGSNSRPLWLGLLVGPLIMVIFYFVVFLIKPYPGDPFDEIPFLVLHVAWVSLPFVVLVIGRIREWVTWIVGIVLTIILYSFALVDAILRSGKHEGANIGLGLLIIISPILISAVCFAIARTRVPSGTK